ncbi:MAG TPA: proline iminopeptidase-family hydrolase [Nocardioidaceae bacterium]|nr:proline iminopeptidase-family hydrolase [Nocardioidaceae bacterium]
MAIPSADLEGTCRFHDWYTWFRVTGSLDSRRAPLVVLHGGPGAAHNYTLRMARVAETGRPVVHYDQLGTGRSTHLPDQSPGFWSVSTFLDELDNLLRRLGLAGGYHLLGQSWGGMLAAEHAATGPPGLRSLVIANSPASMELWVSEAQRLRRLLPPASQEALDLHEADGSLDHPDYVAATAEFYRRHVCRVVPNPPEVAESFRIIEADPTVYHAMNGPTEFHVVGSLRDWTIIDRLDRIDVPTLLVNGRHDEATEAVVRPYYEGIRDVRWEVFGESSHMPHVEEEDKFLDVVNAFLDANE